MATVAESIQFDTSVKQTPSTDHPITSTAFDTVAVLLAVWFMAGLFLDGWAHSHNMVDSFFTPWHAVLYSGFLANATFIVVALITNIRKGHTFWGAIPAGYELTLIGSGIFAMGGILDFLWHTILGIEVNFEALVSPSHLVLAVGLFLIVSGPFRAAWRRSDAKHATILAYLPMLLSLAFTLSVLTFFTFPLHPFVDQWAAARNAPDASVQSGYAAFLLQSGFLMGCLLVALRRWRLPFGSVAFVMTVNAAALSVISQSLRYVPAAFLAGLLADILIFTLKPSINRPLTYRIIAFVVPLVEYILYFVIMASSVGIAWSIPLWSGVIVLSGVVGLMVSYVAVPSQALVAPAQ